MKKYFFTSGAFALAIAMSGLPTIALAESNRGEGGADTQITTVTQVRVSDDADTSVTGSARVDDDEATSSNRRDDDQATSSDDRSDDESINDDQDDRDDFEFELEDDTDFAFSFNDLKQRIENRRHELDDAEASSTPKNRDIMKNANEVRLAVHALLASRDLLGGGIGQQVSEIAKHMNDSAASTTHAEAKMQSRGFLMRLFFGGDNAMADVISRQTAQNQQRIDDLNKLLGEANVSADIEIVLKAQITALQTAQTRLQALALKEQKMWGLFSWRF